MWAQANTVGVASPEPLAVLARDHVVVFPDSPVLGTRQPAEQGRLVVFASGTSGPGGPGGADGGPDVRERVGTLFAAIGQKTVWLDEVGAATRLKLVANSWVLALIGAIGESIALARGLGVDPATGRTR